MDDHGVDGGLHGLAQWQPNPAFLCSSRRQSRRRPDELPRETEERPLWRCCADRVQFCGDAFHDRTFSGALRTRLPTLPPDSLQDSALFHQQRSLLRVPAAHYAQRHLRRRADHEATRGSGREVVSLAGEGTRGRRGCLFPRHSCQHDLHAERDETRLRLGFQKASSSYHMAPAWNLGRQRDSSQHPRDEVDPAEGPPGAPQSQAFHYSRWLQQPNGGHVHRSPSSSVPSLRGSVRECCESGAPEGRHNPSQGRIDRGQGLRGPDQSPWGWRNGCPSQKIGEDDAEEADVLVGPGHEVARVSCRVQDIG
eukprot:RCo005314